MKTYQVLIYQEQWYTAFIPGGGKVNPERFSEFLNIHARQNWEVRTIERESRRTLFFFKREAFV
ncbi:DUF4177 domain-containing protein, partial [Morganella morganii]|uniref:DUF4177 domain-containing protein n=1 Tax=Morganella morganii TaxID=582 RepID=UPI0024B82A21